MKWHRNHPPCPGGCNNLADECACPNPNPLGSMRIVPAIGSAVTACARCEGHPTAPAECAVCVAEVARNRQDARDELIEFIRSDDGTDSGRRLA